ncbi:TetR/AcrR family transcriptional regulator [Paenibacillus sp. FSL K6-1217]|uniref:TetR/AcrR family transcriptional regulator n=1 Tax=Paenibacillus sp. FSL K6-1217 TaxID=2921466 RepID=UPI00324A1C1E
MARPREFDEDKALDAALHVFWEKGFEAASLSDLTARMGIQRPSLYSTFGDKKGLFEAALRKYTGSHAAYVRTSLQKHPSVKEAFRSFFEDVVAKEYEKSPSWGCFCINSMVELAPHDEKFAVLTREHQMYLSVIFQETLERGLRSGELNAGINAKSLAQTLVISLIGLTVFLKSRPDRTVIDHFVQEILTLVTIS